jgi:hypothetical protein
MEMIGNLDKTTFGEMVRVTLGIEGEVVEIG